MRLPISPFRNPVQAANAYINEFITQRAGQRRSSAALVRTVFQRRLASSACAIHESLKRRLQKQQNLLEELEGLSPAQRVKRLVALQGRLTDAEQEDDDLDDRAVDQLIDDYTAAMELDQLRTEIAALKDLVEEARRVREQATDSKLAALQKCLGEAQFQELKDGRGKLLVFTEHRDTLNYVREHLEQWGYTTCEIHGGMNPRERIRAQDVFRTQAQVCVATEAAGEGINLQFCHLMINYDMPWNPTRLEQRMGRIHRIGQDRDVYVFNFIATGGGEGGTPTAPSDRHTLLSPPPFASQFNINKQSHRSEPALTGFSPEGTIVNSPGRKPWECEPFKPPKPRRGDREPG